MVERPITPCPARAFGRVDGALVQHFGVTRLEGTGTDPLTQVVASPATSDGSSPDRYELLDAIGSGATATVWLGRDTETGQTVAVKRFHGHLLGDPEARRRFTDEAAAAKLVSHPNIVSAIDRVSTDDELWLVFPYVAGTSLVERLAEGPVVTPRDAAQISVDLADALAAVHAAGLAHRDVKPGNILLGSDGRARLLDFGISRAVTDQLEQVRDATGAGLAVGTLPYMAPEQLAAHPPTPASDIFALGAVLYEMLAGRRPYAAATAVAMADAHRVAPAQIPEAPDALNDLAMVALAYDPAARPDATQFARAARGWLDGREDPAAMTVVVPAAPAHPVASPWLARMAAGAAAALVLAVLAIGAGSLTTDTPAPSTVVPTEVAQPAGEVEAAGPDAADREVEPPDRTGGDDGRARLGNDARPGGNDEDEERGDDEERGGDDEERGDDEKGKAKGHDKEGGKGKGR